MRSVDLLMCPQGSLLISILRRAHLDFRSSSPRSPLCVRSGIAGRCFKGEAGSGICIDAGVWGGPAWPGQSPSSFPVCHASSPAAMLGGDAADDLTHGVELVLAGALSGGEQFRYFWKAFRPLSGRGGDSLRWEVKRVIIAAGYQETKSMKPWRHVTENWVKWQAQAASCGLDAHACMVPSRHALRKRPQVDMELLARAEQEPVLDTAALLALLVTWPQHRRQVDARERIIAVSVLFFRLTLDPQSLGGMATAQSGPAVVGSGRSLG